MRAIHPINPEKLYPLARGVVAHRAKAMARGVMPRVGLWMAFPPASAVVGHGCDGCC